MTTRSKKVLLPLAILVISAAVTLLVVRSRSPVERVAEAPRPPLVRVQRALVADRQLIVESRGEVRPATRATLVTEVPGAVVWVSESFHAGGFFRRGAPLIRLDRRDYELALTRARAEVERSNVRLIQVRAEAEIALEEWADLGKGDPSPLVRREPQIREAEAALLAAEAAREEAELNLSRTVIRAPYGGRILTKLTDLGQFLGAGQPVAEVYGTATAEVRLPVLDRELAFLELPLASAFDRGPEVQLSATFAGRERRWAGRIVRTEGQIDPATRMIGLVAEVRDPYGPRADGRSPEVPAVPLTVGLFVDAEIRGAVEPVIRLPRSALYEGNAERDRVMVVDGEGRLRFRPVEVLQRTAGEVLLRSGLGQGELVCVSPLEAPVDGMEVRTVEAGSPAEVRP